MLAHAMTAEVLDDLLPVIARWCARLGGRGVDVEEATHDVYLVLIRRAARLEPGVPVEAFAYAITRRVLANHRRRQWWRRWLPGEVPEMRGGASPVEEVEARELVRTVDTLLAELSPAHREVLVLCDMEERPAPEVALLLGVPEGTVRSRLRLARTRFRELAPRFDLPGPEEETS